MNRINLIISCVLLMAGLTITTARPQQSNTPSERLFDLGSLFNRYQRPIYSGGSGYYPGGGSYPGGGYPNSFGGGGFGSYGSNYPSNYPSNGLGTNMLGGGFGGGLGNSFGYGGYGGYGGYY